MIKYLSLEEILRLHFEIIKDFGGSHGVRDADRLKTVVQAPAQEVFDTEMITSVQKSQWPVCSY